MSDLISREALYEAISYALYSSIRLDVSDIRDIINNQPTAYDVDKVIEKLEEIQQKILPLAYESDYFCGQLALINRIVLIIKDGGKNE